MKADGIYRPYLVDSDVTDKCLADAAVRQQVLADRIGLATSLTAGEYSRAWNEITVRSDDVTEVSVSLTCMVRILRHVARYLEDIL